MSETALIGIGVTVTLFCLVLYPLDRPKPSLGVLKIMSFFSVAALGIYIGHRWWSSRFPFQDYFVTGYIIWFPLAGYLSLVSAVDGLVMIVIRGDEPDQDENDVPASTALEDAEEDQSAWGR